ncbi:MAG TPA: winged helix-turn-helix domain-containing protein [Terriglobia bacterium]|nr:winged helix-turn-helix domain-containing protein [Terriglobia bacterium]
MSVQETGEAPRIFHFGVFEADAAAGELRKGGLKVKLQQQPYQVLLKLLENRGEVVTREELRNYLWGAETFVDFEHGLNRAVNRVREALGDSADRPRYVETLPGRGYRFIAPVHPLEPPGVPLPVEPANDPVRSPDVQRGVAGRMTTVVLAVLVLLAAGYFGFSRLTSPAPRILGSLRITNDGRMKTVSSPLFYISRPLITDGSRVYFMESTGEGRKLAQVSASGGETVFIPVPSRQSAPTDISPNGSDLLLVESAIGTEGETPLSILRIADGSVRRAGDMHCHDAAWSPDGSEITCANGHGLYLARPDGTHVRKLASLAGTAWWPRWSPDGKTLRFTLIDAQSDSTSLWEVSRDGSDLRPLLSDWNNPPSECCGVWTADGKHYVFQSTRDGQTNVWVMEGTRSRFRGSDVKPVQLTVGPTDSLAPVPSRDGKKLFVVGVMPHGELSRYDSASGQFVPYLSGISAEQLDFSRDGRWITYVAYPEGTLWRSKVDGTERMQLTTSPVRAYLPRWSPDGHRIAFAAASPGEPWKVHVVSAEGGELRHVTDGQCSQGDAGWSPDGNVLVFGCLAGYGPPDSTVHLIDLRTNEVSTVPGSQGLFSPRWSPDGRYLAAVAQDTGKMLLFDFKTRKWTNLVNVPVGYPTWSRDSRYIYFDSYSDDRPALYRLRISDRALEQVANLKGLRRAWGAFDPWSGLAPDDSPLVLRDAGTQEIYALDWQAP